MPAKRSLEFYNQFAIARGGRCLSTKYINSGARYEWECEQQHRWFAAAGDIQRGKWCPYCAGLDKKNIEWLQWLAQNKGGRCLSSEYINSQTKYEWGCKEEHRWFAKACSIRQGQWCPYCAGLNKKSVEWVHGLALKQGGRCLSTVYTNNHTKYEWQCKEGHRWFAVASNIQQGNWCKRCAGHDKKNLEWLRELAKQKEGRCLSTEYIDTQTKYEWECKEGHRWGATANNVQRGTWCSTCKPQFSKPEVELRDFMMWNFWDLEYNIKGLLKNKRFELDIHVPSLKKAIEFDGDYWHHSEWAIKHGSKDRDARKNQQCIEAGIELLRIKESDYKADSQKVQQDVLAWLSTETIPETILENK